MPRSRYQIHHPSEPHFLTCTVVGWLPVFAQPEAAQVVLDSLRFLQKEGRLALFGYCILENHLHVIASAEDLVKEVAEFRSFTARRIIDLLKAWAHRSFLAQLERHRDAERKDRPYQLWQDGTHPQLLQGEAMVRQKLEYIHNNPVRCGYVDEPVQWRYSSARNYAGLPGLIEVCTDW